MSGACGAAQCRRSRGVDRNIVRTGSRALRGPVRDATFSLSPPSPPGCGNSNGLVMPLKGKPTNNAKACSLHETKIAEFRIVKMLIRWLLDRDSRSSFILALGLLQRARARATQLHRRPVEARTQLRKADRVSKGLITKETACDAFMRRRCAFAHRQLQIASHTEAIISRRVTSGT